VRNSLFLGWRGAGRAGRMMQICVEPRSLILSCELGLEDAGGALGGRAGWSGASHEPRGTS
jgi:hypothetical protein